jgi:hypothetical protein
MTSLLKQYLRELPEPLLTYTTFYAWKEAINCMQMMCPSSY